MAKARTKKTEAVEQSVEQPGAHAPPWDYGVDITESQLEELRLRAGREDYKQMILALQKNKQLTVVPDP